MSIFSRFLFVPLIFFASSISIRAQTDWERLELRKFDKIDLMVLAARLGATKDQLDDNLYRDNSGGLVNLLFVEIVNP